MIDTATATLKEIRRAGVEALQPGAGGGRDGPLPPAVRDRDRRLHGGASRQIVGKAGVRALAAEQIQREQTHRRSA